MKKTIIIISLSLLVCFLPVNTFAECIKGDCVNGQGTFTFPDGWKYAGEYKGGKRHGKGVYIFRDGRRQVGEWKDGEFYK